MDKFTEAQNNIFTYFRSKKEQLLIEAKATAAQHSGLRGSHREAIFRTFLDDFLPLRYRTGNGMVYGPYHRSKEADIVVWDADNNPRMEMAGHTIFFADSVRAVIEVKTRWSTNEFKDILMKCRTVKDIIVPTHTLNLEDELASMRQELFSLRTGQEHDGTLIKKPHIGTAAVIFYGGTSLKPNRLNKYFLENIDDCWPDITILIEKGVLIVKDYPELDSDESPELIFIDAGEHALLFFMDALLKLISHRSVQTEQSVDISEYLYGSMTTKIIGKVPFQLTRPISGRIPIWRK